MKKVIKSVLEKFGTQTNLGSESARERITDEIVEALHKNDNYLYEDEVDEGFVNKRIEDSWKCELCNGSTYNLDYDYIGSGTNHLSCEVRLELDEKKRNGHREYPYNSFVRNKGEADKLKVQAKSPYNDGWTRQYYKEKENAKQIIDKLSEEIVSNNDTGYIYETPDGGKTVFRRDVGSDKRELVENWKELKKE